MTDLIHRPRRLRKSAALRAMFEETTLSLNDLVLPIFVEEELDDYKAIEAMPGVMRIPEKHLAREIERIANAGIRSVMTFGISHHTDDTGSDAWKEDRSGGADVAYLQADRTRNDRNVRHLLLRIYLPRSLRRAV